MLNADGYLDAGLHDMSVDQLESAFVAAFPTSKTRPQIFSGYQKHSAELSALGVPMEQFINGSFTTNKEDPGDVDLVCFADAESIDKLSPDQQAVFEKLVAGKATKASHHCDAYFCATVPETDPLYPQVRANRKYWMGEFGYDRTDKPKGIVRTQIIPTAKP